MVGDKRIDGSMNLIINNAAINAVVVNDGNNPPGTLAVTGKKEMVDLFVTNAVAPMLFARAVLNMLIRCLAGDYKRDGILVIAIHPGWVKTDMGGPHVLMRTEDSAKGMLNVMSTLTEKHNGSLLDWEGNGIPW
ncbi:unnamed protein product, partial [Coregonus sp. 'balchen']